MGKSRSITQQLIHAVTDCSAIGESKRSYKEQNGDTGYKVFSVEYKNDLRKTASDLGAYIREHTDIKLARDIDPDTLQGYLQHKVEAGCSAAYVGKMQSHIVKLERCCQHTFGKTDWHTDRLRVPAMQDTPVEKIRDKVATDYEYARLIGEMRRPGSGEAWKAVVLSREAGLRVQETANVCVGRLRETGGRWGCGTLTLQGKTDGCKGGRWRTVDILTPEARERLLQVTAGLRPGDHIVRGRTGEPMQPDSINRALQRAIARCPDLQEHWRANNGLHAFRKAFAQQSYDAARNSGCSKRESADYANRQLGHGNNRTDLTKAYISNLW